MLGHAHAMKTVLLIISSLVCSLCHAQEITSPSATTSGMVLVGTVSNAHADDQRLRFFLTGTAAFTVRNYFCASLNESQ